MTLAEEFLLLALRDDTGKPWIDGTKLGAALAGAAIMELALDGALRLTEDDDSGHRAGRLVATGRAPADSRLAGLIPVVDDRKPKDAVGKVAGFTAWNNRAEDLKSALLVDLAEAGALTEERRKVLGLFPTTVWKAADPSLEAAVLQRVGATVRQGADPDDRTAALISILQAVDLLPKLFPDADKRSVRDRGQEISESDWGGQAVRKAVQEIQAVTATVITTSIIATGAT
ncbi:MAG: GPP34 family phosphoprotein [Streptosporangiaceae bacterium]